VRLAAAEVTRRAGGGSAACFSLSLGLLCFSTVTPLHFFFIDDFDGAAASGATNFSSKS
jgi:hypothetical protein